MLRPECAIPHIEVEGDHFALLRHILNTQPLHGTALEFGVGTGESLALIANHMPAIGFDSFQGLPEDWRPDFPKGMFAARPPAIVNTRLVIGLFADTLPGFAWPDDIGIVHLDADLYSSTKTVLEHVPLKPGCIIVFDEWHGYDGCEQHEQRAWREHTADHDLTYTPIGTGHQQAAFRIEATCNV